MPRRKKTATTTTAKKTTTRQPPQQRRLEKSSKNDENDDEYTTTCTAQNQYFHCYCLRSEHPQHPHKTYVGFTTNPHRRLRQHNGIVKGGAWRTRRGGGRPWTFAAIVQGFANKIVALQFEWAWQHCDKSLAVRAQIGDAAAKTLRRKRGVAGQLTMLKTLIQQCGDLYGRVPLTVYFFESKYKELYEQAQLLPLVPQDNDDDDDDKQVPLMMIPTLQLISSVEDMPFYAVRNQRKARQKKSTTSQAMKTTHQPAAAPTESSSNTTTAKKKLGQMDAIHDRHRKAWMELDSSSSSSADEEHNNNNNPNRKVGSKEHPMILDFDAMDTSSDDERGSDHEQDDVTNSDDDETSWLTTSLKELSVGSANQDPVVQQDQDHPPTTFSIHSDSDSDSLGSNLPVVVPQLKRKSAAVGSTNMATTFRNDVICVDSSSEDDDSSLDSALKVRALKPRFTEKSARNPQPPNKPDLQPNKRTESTSFLSSRSRTEMDWDSSSDDDDNDDLFRGAVATVTPTGCHDKNPSSPDAANRFKRTVNGAKDVEVIDLCSP